MASGEKNGARVNVRISAEMAAYLEMLAQIGIHGKTQTEVAKMEEYPEIRDKPYRSVLAIPLIASDGKTVFGALSIDSPKPYSFQSFEPMATENRLENGLQGGGVFWLRTPFVLERSSMGSE